MKVGILTLVLHSNFGYLMQNYALQQAIIKLGHQPYTIQIWESVPSCTERLIGILKSIVARILFGRKCKIIPATLSREEKSIIDKNTIEFINKNIILSPKIAKIKDVKKLSKTYDAFIVGSDQVWRRWYAPHLQTYYFCFLPKTKKRMAYAASFGTSDLNYSKKQLKECSQALDLFEKVTVRESDAINILQNQLNYSKAKVVVDPTFLIPKEDYLKLINIQEDSTIPRTPFILSYILDTTQEKTAFINNFANVNNLQIYSIKPSIHSDSLKERIYPPISRWIKAFNEASFVITDSFHGTAFSIIFRKQFYSIVNTERGESRFTTLLGGFGLQNRLIRDVTTPILHTQNIDYASIEIIIEDKITESKNQLKSFLDDL